MNFFNQILFLTITRCLADGFLGDHVRDTLTPSRVAAFLHGINVSFSIVENDWDTAVASTALFFILDLYFHYLFGTRINLEMKLHHIAGACLCIYSAISRSYSFHHLGSELTKALILMETTNPLLQFLITLRNENLQEYLNKYSLYFIKLFFFFHFVFIRIVVLGKALYYTWQKLSYGTTLEVSMFWISLAMFFLQCFWLGKIIQSVRSV